MEHTLLYFRQHFRNPDNQIYAFPEGCGIQFDPGHVVGQLDVDPGLARVLYRTGDRQETGITIHPRGKLTGHDKEKADEFLALIPDEAVALVEFSVLEGSIDDMLLTDVAFHLGTNPSGRKLFCTQSNEGPEVAEKDSYRFIRVGSATGIPRAAFRTQSRYRVNSASSRNEDLAAPQITFPLRSKYNHFKYGLGDMD